MRLLDAATKFDLLADTSVVVGCIELAECDLAQPAVADNATVTAATASVLTALLRPRSCCESNTDRAELSSAG
jgi:3-hydroxyacyl-CoA dehydrogenase